MCGLAEAKVMTNLHSDPQKVHLGILQKTPTFEFPLRETPPWRVQRKFPQKCMTSKHLKGRLGLGPPIGWLDRVLTRRDPLLVG